MDDCSSLKKPSDATNFTETINTGSELESNSYDVSSDFDGSENIKDFFSTKFSTAGGEFRYEESDSNADEASTLIEIPVLNLGIIKNNYLKRCHY